MTALETLARNRDLALAEAETMHKNGHNSLSQFAYGQVQAYSESIRIITAAAANLRTPAGDFACSQCAPTDVTLTISEHDDQRAVAE